MTNRLLEQTVTKRVGFGQAKKMKQLSREKEMVNRCQRSSTYHTSRSLREGGVPDKCSGVQRVS